MAWNDSTLDPRRPAPRGAIDMGATSRTLDDSVARQRELGSNFSQNVGVIQQRAMEASEPQWDEAEFGINEETNEILLPNGKTVPIDAPTLMTLATIENENGEPLPKLREFPKGFRPISQARMRQIIDEIPTESDFFGEAWANFKSSVGLAGAAIDSLIGNDDPSNAWSRAAQEYESQQSLGELKASRGSWYSSYDSFMNGLGQLTGNVAGNVAMTLPAIGAGVATGGPVGAIATGTAGFTGGLSAFGEQATEFYAVSYDAMMKMSPETLAAESPLYREIAAENPGMPHEEIVREVAIQGSRAAGAPAGLLGAAESMVGSKLAGNFLSRLGVSRLASATAPVKKPGLLNSAGRATGRAVGGGLASGAQEVGETALGQSAGAAYTGIGDTNPLSYVSGREFEEGALGGLVFGALGGRRGRDPAQVAKESDIGAALTGSPDANTSFSRARELTPEEDQVPTALRRAVIPGSPVPSPAASPAPAAGVQEAYQLRDRLRALLAERFGAQWEGNVDAIAAAPQGRQLLAQLMDVERTIQTGAEPLVPGQVPPAPSPFGPNDPNDPTIPAYMRRQAVPPGQPTLSGPAFGDQPAPPAAPVQQVNSPEPLEAPQERTPDGRPMGVSPPALVNPEPMDPAEAASRQQTQRNRRKAAGAPVGAAAGVPPAAGAATPAQVAAAAQASEEQVSPSTAEPIEDIEAQLDTLADPESGRDAVFIAEPEEGQASEGLALAQRFVEEMRQAGAEYQIVERPGVGVLVTANPKKAQSFRTKKLTDRVLANILGYSESKADAIATGEAPVVVQAVTPAGAVAAEQVVSKKGVKGAKAAVKKLGGKGTTVVETTPEAAQERRAAAPKGAKLKRGQKAAEAPAAQVEEAPAPAPAPAPAKGAKLKRAKAKAKPAEAPPKLKRVKKRAEAKNDPEPPTEPDPPKGAKLKRGKGKAAEAKSTPPKQEKASGKGKTRAQKARTADTPAAADVADTVERAASLPKATVSVNNEPMRLPTKLVTTTGNRGASVDLRVLSVDETTQAQLNELSNSGRLSDTDKAAVDKVLLQYDQLERMLDAAVDTADESLRTRLTEAGEGDAVAAADARALELELAAADGTRGRPRTTPRTPLILSLPLTRSEVLGYLRAVRDEAKAELSRGYAPGTSVVRQMLEAIDSRFEDLLRDELKGRALVQFWARLTDAELDAVVDQTRMKIQNMTVAKQAMRGATAIARAMKRAENEFNRGRYKPAEAPTEKLPHVNLRGSFPKRVAAAVNEWVDIVQRKGNKLSAPITLMTTRDAAARFPDVFLADKGNPNGRVIPVRDEKGNVTEYVLALNWDGILNDGYALEVLAHEFGHIMGRELYTRADPKTKALIDKAFNAWRKRNKGKSATDILMGEVPPIEALERVGDADAPLEYVAAFDEWLARNVALYVLDPNRPYLTAVERFFKRLADIVRAVYAKMAPKAPEREIAEAMDRWVDGAMEAGTPQPLTEDVVFDHAQDAVPTAGSSALVRGPVRAATAAINGLRGLVAPEAGQTQPAVGDTKWWSRAKGYGLHLLTMRQIARMYGDTPFGKPLRNWVRLQQLKAKTANTAMEPGAKWMEQAHQLDDLSRSQLERVMYLATHYGVHPDRALSDKTNAHLLRGSATVKSTNEARYYHVRKLYEEAVKADARVAEIYAGLRDSFTELYANTLQQKKDNIENANFSEGAKKLIIERIEAAAREIREGPYFPMMRFGEWIVSVNLPAFYVGQKGAVEGVPFESKEKAREEMRNQRSLNPGAKVAVEPIGDNQYVVRVYQKGVYFFESEREAIAARAEIEAEARENYAANDVKFDDAAAALADEDGDNAIITAPKLAADYYNESKQGSDEFLNEVRALMREGKMDPEVAASLERLAIESMPEFSYRKSTLPRQNVFGASKNMLRAYAHRFQGAAHHYSNVVHAAPINASWSSLQDFAKTNPRAQQIMNVLRENQQAVADRMEATTTNAVMNTVTDVSSLYSLGFSPVYVLMNSMQPWTVSLPVLGAMTTSAGKSVGLTKAAAYLGKAYEGAVPFFTRRALADFVDEARAVAGKRGQNTTLQDSAKAILSKFAKTDGERAMLESLLERGTLDFSWLNSLEDAMRGGKLAHRWAAVQRMGMAFPQQVEAMNRVVTALAAYRIARDEKMVAENSEVLLQEFADDVVAQTQLDYSRANRPLLFNRQFAGVLLQFKLYMQGMYVLMGTAVGQALKGRTKQERVQGFKTFAYLMASHAAVAGAAGLGPIAGLAKLGLVVAAQFTEDDDDDWMSGEQLLSGMMKDLFGENAGLIAERGLPALLGFDISDRVGLPVLADSRYANIREGDSASTAMDKWVLYSFGAPYANARRLVQGAADTKEAVVTGDADKLWDASRALPAGLRSLAQSARWYNEGVIDRDGDTFIARDKLGWNDLALQSLGLTPSEVSKAYRDRNEVKRTTAEIMKARSRLMQQARTGDDVADEIREFNRSVPKSFHITREQLRRSREAKREREAGRVNDQEAAVRELIDG